MGHSNLLTRVALIWDIVDPSALGHYRRLSRPVDGWLTRREEAILFRLARGIGPEHCIVELGSWLGRSTILLAGGSRTGKSTRVFAVDHFRALGGAKEFLEKHAGDLARDYWGQFHSNMHAANVDQLVHAIRGDTAEAAVNWNGPPVGLLFVDADHSYSGVRRDWEHWHGRLARGGIVAFHDYQNPGGEVTRFVDELLAAGRLTSVEQHDSILLGEVVRDASAA